MRRLIPCLLLALALPAAPLAADVVTLRPSADTTLFEENGDASDGKGPALYSGRITLTFIRRALLRFDVAGSVPAGATITDVQLSLVLTQARGNPVDVYLFRNTAAWGEGTSNAGLPGGSGAQATAGDATWTMRAWPATPWLAPGGDTAALPSAKIPVQVTLQTYTFGSTPEMLADVQGWYDQPGTNSGWQVRNDELQAAPSARRWGSRESANPAEQPVLTITYTPPVVVPPPPAAAVKDVPALSGRALAALGAALALLGALALRKA
jgi:hypothetical protein